MKKLTWTYTPPFYTFLFERLINRKECNYAYNKLGGEVHFAS